MELLFAHERGVWKSDISILLTILLLEVRTPLKARAQRGCLRSGPLRTGAKTCEVVLTVLGLSMCTMFTVLFRVAETV